MTGITDTYNTNMQNGSEILVARDFVERGLAPSEVVAMVKAGQTAEQEQQATLSLRALSDEMNLGHSGGPQTGVTRKFTH